jgi:diaminopimelate decarboxylase
MFKGANIIYAKIYMEIIQQTIDIMHECNVIEYQLFTHYSLPEIIKTYLEKNDHSNRSFFLVDIGQIVKLHEVWKDCLPDVQPYYAVKCNPNSDIIRMLSKIGVNFDCASKKEIEMVLSVTQDPSRIIYANPCKQLDYIKYATEQSVDLMTFDCELELSKIKLCSPNARLLLRIAVDDSGSVVKFSSKFGCKPEDIEGLLITAKKLDLNIVGFSFHVGSGCHTPYQYYNAIYQCKLACNIADKLGITCSMIDIGGGFPGQNIEYLFYDIAHSVRQAMEDFFLKEIEEKTIEFIAEPGRYFAESTHTLVVNIIGKKIMKSTAPGSPLEYVYYINDGVYGSFNCIFFDHARPVIKTMCENGDQLYSSKIFGPTCDSIDVVAEKIMLPELFVGDWLYVDNFGAYTGAAGSEFNGMEKPVNYYMVRE